MRAHSCQKGFTLIEVLVAMSILSIILGVIYSSFFAASRASKMVELDEDVYQTARSLFAMLTTELRSVYFDPTSGLGGLNGSGNSIGFVTTSHVRKAKDSKEGFMAEVSYFFDSSSLGEQEYLIKSVDPSVDSDYDSGGRLYPLTDRVEEMNITYHYPEDDEWLEEWRSESADPEELSSQEPEKPPLPDRIKIELSVLDANDKPTRFQTVIQPNLYRPLLP